MRGLLTKTLVLTAATVMHSHAIFGLGGHWTPAPSLSVAADSGAAFTGGGKEIGINNKGVDGLNGFGAKLWIDVLPFIDIELAGNLQFGAYDVDMIFPSGAAPGTTVVPLKFDLGMPLAPSTPIFARATGDLAILYPFLKLPPVITIAKFYAGAGMSYGVATEVLTPEFAKKALDKEKANNSSFDAATATQDKISSVLIDAIKDEALQTGVGFFLQLGAHVKPPIIPLAIYADVKYHFLSYMPDALEGADITLELGGALAF